jgi:hypothetical protein
MHARRTKRVIKARTFQDEYIEETRQTPQRDQWTETEFMFDITDITASVYVLLLDKVSSACLAPSMHCCDQ